MTFLPVVDRELRVAARKCSTFWVRVGAAGVALVLGSVFMILGEFLGPGGSGPGDALFSVLTAIALAAALLAGLFFTSDCLSEEKREGTLGFLFLSDLRGYEVVGGKLLATSLRGFYALLAVLPILGLTILMGGMAGERFFKASLALVNALFCSLSAGLVVSALSRDSQKAIVMTALVVGIWAGGGPLADLFMGKMTARGSGPVLSLASPGYAYALAEGAKRSPYWLSLGISHGAAWVLFGLACLLAPRTWQEKAGKLAMSNRPWAYAWKYGTARWRAALRSKLIDLNPALWLACRERAQSRSAGFLAILCAGALLVALCTDSQGLAVWIVGNYAMSVLVLLFYLVAASQACRFFVEARRSGFLELLLVSPITVKDIVYGQWRALIRMFGLPILLVLVVKGTLLVMTQSGRSGFAALGGSGLTWELVALMGAVGVVSVAANLVALAWFGMWMGMTSKTANLAILKTLVFVQIIPGFVLSFASSLLIFALNVPRIIAGMGPSSFQIQAWLPVVLVAVVPAVLTLGKDLGFILWSRARLYGSFREQAVRSLRPATSSISSVMARPISPPPVIVAQG